MKDEAGITKKGRKGDQTEREGPLPAAPSDPTYDMSVDRVVDATSHDRTPTATPTLLLLPLLSPLPLFLIRRRPSRPARMGRIRPPRLLIRMRVRRERRRTVRGMLTVAVAAVRVRAGRTELVHGIDGVWGAKGWGAVGLRLAKDQTRSERCQE